MAKGDINLEGCGTCKLVPFPKSVVVAKGVKGGEITNRR